MRTALDQNPFADNNQKVTFIMITVEYFQFVAKVTYHFQKRDLIQLSFHRLVVKEKKNPIMRSALEQNQFAGKNQKVTFITVE